MQDIRWIRENAEIFDQGLVNRGLEPQSALLIELDDKRKTAISALQDIQSKRNALSREIAEAKRNKEETKAQELQAQVSQLKDEMPVLEQAEREVVTELETKLSAIPNTPRAEVPVGKDEQDNQLKSAFGTPASFSSPKQHFELGEALGLMDFDAASKMSGSRFVVLKGELARLERALGQFMINLHTTDHGYCEVSPPLIVRDEAMFGTAQLPKFRDDQFAVTENSWLIPTAEVPLTNLVRESILNEEELPLRFTALTACFRAEAGAAGRDTRGMLRQHQFLKCELVSITTPEKSGEEHERMLACAEKVLQLLEIPYRVMLLCTGDMGFASEKTYDIEAWLPGQNTYREISSCSVCGDFQARRMNTRFRSNQTKETKFVHTLNGSGVAVGRMLIAVMENYQNEDGSIAIPHILRPYMGGATRIG